MYPAIVVERRRRGLSSRSDDDDDDDERDDDGEKLSSVFSDEKTTSKKKKKIADSSSSELRDFLADVEWTARKILRDSNRRRKDDARRRRLREEGCDGGKVAKKGERRRRSRRRRGGDRSEKKRNVDDHPEKGEKGDDDVGFLKGEGWEAEGGDGASRCCSGNPTPEGKKDGIEKTEEKDVVVEKCPPAASPAAVESKDVAVAFLDTTKGDSLLFPSKPSGVPIAGRESSKKRAARETRKKRRSKAVAAIHEDLKGNPLFGNSSLQKEVDKDAEDADVQSMTTERGISEREHVTRRSIEREILARDERRRAKKGPSETMKKRKLRRPPHAKSAEDDRGRDADWNSTKGLRKKYRCETCRTEAFEEHARRVREAQEAGPSELDTNKGSDDDEASSQMALVKEHPIHERVKLSIAQENRYAKDRTDAKLAKLSFATTVHRLWIQNLPHLKEYKDDGATTTTTDDDEEDGDDGGPTERDSAAIVAGDSQIQSVSRAWATRPFETTERERQRTLRRVDRGRGDEAFEALRRRLEESRASSKGTVRRRHRFPSRSQRLVDGEDVLLPSPPTVDGAALKATVCRVVRGDGRNDDDAVVDSDTAEFDWSLQFRRMSDGFVQRFVLSDVDAQSLVDRSSSSSFRGEGESRPVDGRARRGEGERLVHAERISSERVPGANGENEAYACRVWIKTEGRFVVAVVRLGPADGGGRGGGGDDDYEEARGLPFLAERKLYAHDVLALVGGGGRRRGERKSLDYDFWAGDGASEEGVWSTLLRNLVLNDAGDGSVSMEFVPSAPSSSARARRGQPPHERIPTRERRSSGDWDDCGEEWEDCRTLSKGTTDDSFAAVKFAYDLAFAVVDERTTTGSNPSSGPPLTMSAAEEKFSRDWHEARTESIDAAPSLTLRIAAGRLLHLATLCPGCADVGEGGLWWNSPRGGRAARAAASFLRDEAARPFASTIVLVALALGSPVLVPAVRSWEGSAFVPRARPHERPDGIVSSTTARCVDVLARPVMSETDSRRPPTVLALNPAADEKDWNLPFLEDGGGNVHHRRDRPSVTKHGFRVTCLSQRIEPDGFIPRHVFGVTERGATPNETFVTERKSFHSEECCFGTQLSRRRSPLDYHYVLESDYTDKDGGSPNQPTIFTMHMATYKLDVIARESLEAYEQREREKRSSEERRRKRAALAAKIDAAARRVEAKVAEDEERSLRDAMAKVSFTNDEGHDSKSTEPLFWEDKVRVSVVLSTKEIGKAKWEERLDPTDQTTFYRRLNPPSEKSAGIVQLDPPDGWGVPARLNGRANDDVKDMPDAGADFSSPIRDPTEGGDGRLAVPRLKLPSQEESHPRPVPSMDSLESHSGVRGYGWRRLPRAIIGADFFRHNKCKLEKCKGELFNRCNSSRIVGMVDPAIAISYEIDNSTFQTPLESQLIKDVSADRHHLARTKQAHKERGETILNSSQRVALERILEIKLEEGEEVEAKSPHVIPIDEEERPERNAEEDEGNDADLEPERDDTDAAANGTAADREARAILSVKTANYDVLEEILDDHGTPVDTRDEHGNTLLILSCQQGNKKMAKFLLRRGASINAQNHTGNTVLHYLHEYGHQPLAEYLVRKGANDGYLNADGLTCYEGVSRENLELM